MAFDLFGASGGTTTTTPKTTTPEPTIANLRQVDQRVQNTPTTFYGNWFDPRTASDPRLIYSPMIYSPAPVSYSILPINYASQAAQPYQPAISEPTPTTTVPNIATQPPNISRVPNMPEGYGYAYGFPFRGKQPKGWNIESPTVPDWANNSTGFNWADASAYGSGVDKTAGSPVKFAEQGKGKGLSAQDTYNRVANLSKTMAQAGLQQYRTDNLKTWGPWYDAALGKGAYDTQHWWTTQDYNNLAKMFVDQNGNPVEMGIQVLQPTTQAQAANQGTSAYMNTLAGRMSEAQRKLVEDWLRKYGGGGRTIADTFLGQAGRLADQLTARPAGPTTSGATGGSGGSRVYYGGGGGGYGYGGGGGGYSPSWYNGLLSWRI